MSRPLLVGSSGRWLTLLLVFVVLVFAATGLPGNPARAILGRDADARALRRDVRAAAPRPVRCQQYLTGWAACSTGTSAPGRHRPVTDVISSRLLNSRLTLVAGLVAHPAVDRLWAC